MVQRTQTRTPQSNLCLSAPCKSKQVALSHHAYTVYYSSLLRCEMSQRQFVTLGILLSMEAKNMTHIYIENY